MLPCFSFEAHWIRGVLTHWKCFYALHLYITALEISKNMFKSSLAFVCHPHCHPLHPAILNVAFVPLKRSPNFPVTRSAHVR